MKLKKLISTILVVTILALQFTGFSFIMPDVVYAEPSNTTIATKYFYNQLTDDAKVFYNVMDKMFFENDYSKLKAELENPDTKFGVDSHELTEEIENSESLKAKLTAYTKGNQDLLNTMGAAKDAYAADHAGIFYIDFDNITLRVTQDAEKKLHVFLGIGRTKTYINKAFWNEAENKVEIEKLKTALDEVQRVKDEKVAEVKAVQPQAGQSLIEQQVRKAHDIVIKENSYRLEEDIIEDNKTIDNDEEKGDPWNVRTVYGAFGPKHQIVCEGFSRALKMILDDMNIPCVLVYGAYTSGSVYEEHMWNYVQLEDGKWYAIDSTWDNTDEIIDNGYQGQQERISTEYFLAGQDKMSLNHLVTGIMSVSNYEFKYPALEKTSDRYDIASENAGLRVEIDDESYDEEEEIVASKFKISYAIDLDQDGVIDPGERMGYKKAKQYGYYLVGKFTGYNVPDYDDFHSPVIGGQEEGWGTNDYFGYVTDDYGSLVDIDEENGDSYLSFYNSNSQFIQFGVTTIPPYDGEIKTMEDLERATTYFGTSEDLVAMSDMVFNPNGTYVAAPYVKRATPVLNSTMHIGETYHCTIEYDDVLVPTDGMENVGININVRKSSNPEKNRYSLTNFKFDGESTFEFDFTPSDLYADDAIFYDISFTGVIGSKSGKKPMETGYFCAHKCSAYAYKSQGIDWNVYGKPTLMDDVNLDNLTEEENSELSDLLKHRLTLVTTTTKPSEKAAMEGLLEDEDINGTVEKTETYNIALTLCKKQKIQDGQAVRVMLGFPAGYGPEDAGVTFKAYHYKKDKYGNIVGVEEIPCMVTELGLVIECSSFSPFTIATIKDNSEIPTPKTEQKTIIFQSSQGGTVTVDEQPANKLELNATENNLKTIKIKPEEGYVVDDIVIGQKVIDVNGEDENPNISTDEQGETTYELKYEDLSEEKYDALIAKVAFIPKTTKDSEKEKGYDVVAQPLKAEPSFEMSTEVNRIVKNGDEEIKESTTTFNKDDEIEITYKLSGMTAVGEEGVSKLEAVLAYNKDVLEYKADSLKCEEGWNIQYNQEKISGTYQAEPEAEGTVKSKQIGNMFTMRFTVKQDVGSIQSITLKDINKGEEGAPTAQDVTTNIEINGVAVASTEDKLEKVEGATCEIIGNTITFLEPGTTVAELNKQLTAGDKLITYYGSKLIKDEEGNIVEENPGASKTAVKLVDNDILSTGAIVKVGEKIWTIAITGDLDGDGALTVNDLTLFKLNYIEEQPLAGVYLEAAEIDGEVSEDGLTSINDLVRMNLYYTKEEESLIIKK